jgi:hypothetical protein
VSLDTSPLGRRAKLTFDDASYKRLLVNLKELPRRVGLRVLRIALNAWGGEVKAVAQSRVKRVSGLLYKSLTVKVKIPAASFNTAHQSKPAYVMIGPSRSVSGLVRSVAGERKGVTLARLQKTGFRGNLVRRVRPSRYAHFVEKGIAGKKQIEAAAFIGPAQEAGKVAGMNALSYKLEQGIAAEAAKLAKGSP